MDTLNIFIGFDSSNYGQELAYEVCKRSIIKNTKMKCNFYKMVKSEMIKQGIFKRTDKDGATEFTYTRFFVPYLSNYKGYSLFCDSDFLWTCDINGTMNKDYRVLFLNKRITERKFKQMIHMRYKRHNFNKQIANLIRSTFDIVELMLWEIADSSENNFDSIEKLYTSNANIYDGIKDLIKQTNTNLVDVVHSFGYRALITLGNNMRGFPYRFKN